MSENPNNRTLALSQKIYGRLLRAYPQSHREQYGSAMAQLFRDQCRDAWNESQNWGVMKLWLRVLPDLVSTSILERLAALNERKSMNDKLANLFGFRTTPAIVFFRVFVPVFVLVFGASVVITFILPETYASTARIKVEADASPASGQMSSYNPHFLQTTFEILQTQLVLGPVIDKLNLNTLWGKKYNNNVPLKTDETMQMLKQRVSLSPERNTKLINITVYSGDKVEAAQIANAVAESYQQYRLKLQADIVMKKNEPLRNQYQQEGKRIQQAQTDLETLRQQFNIASDATVSQSPQEKPYWDKKRDLENMIEVRKLLDVKIVAEGLNAQIPMGSTVEIVDKAQPGQAPARPNKTLNIVLGMVIGILLGLTTGAGAAGIASLFGKRLHRDGTGGNSGIPPGTTVSRSTNDEFRSGSLLRIVGILWMGMSGVLCGLGLCGLGLSVLFLVLVNGPRFSDALFFSIFGIFWAGNAIASFFLIRGRSWAKISVAVMAAVCAASGLFSWHIFAMIFPLPRALHWPFTVFALFTACVLLWRHRRSHIGTSPAA